MKLVKTTTLLSVQCLALSASILMMVVDNTFMIQINAEKGMGDDLTAYANAIGLKKLSNFK